MSTTFTTTQNNDYPNEHVDGLNFLNDETQQEDGDGPYTASGEREGDGKEKGEGAVGSTMMIPNNDDNDMALIDPVLTYVMEG